jgi:hypothetical protein
VTPSHQVSREVSENQKSIPLSVRFCPELSAFAYLR